VLVKYVGWEIRVGNVRMYVYVEQARAAVEQLNDQRLELLSSGKRGGAAKIERKGISIGECDWNELKRSHRRGPTFWTSKCSLRLDIFAYNEATRRNSLIVLIHSSLL
jgi:hypothetical protein